ncbi:hypothetical protein V1525DRAFT_335379 [Lipomyces kononenkoae]|uniref:Uncharacterized protein n=1 Tax=Lipomyces kononenkoae TaxID=34357 RepID=A0ACC3TAT0_LIPKO
MSLRPRPESAAEVGLLSEADKRRLRTTKYPPEFDEVVDLSRVNFPVIKTWIANQISEIAGGDDIVTEYTVSLFEQDNKPPIKAIQIQLEGFLPSSTIAANFCKDLWNLLLEAQDSPSGIPAKLIEQKKIEVQEALNRRSALEERRKLDVERAAKLDEVRQRERKERDERRRREDGRDRNDRTKTHQVDTVSKDPPDADRLRSPYSKERRIEVSHRERSRRADGSPERDYRRDRERADSPQRRRDRDYIRDDDRRRNRSRDYSPERLYSRGDSKERRRRELPIERRRDHSRDRVDGRHRQYRDRSLDRSLDRSRDRSRDRKRNRDRSRERRERSRDRRYTTDNHGFDRGRSRSRERRHRNSRDYELDYERERERAMSPGRAQRRLEREREFQERLSKRQRYED